MSEYPHDNFFTHYFNYIDYPNNTEASLSVHRWSCISIIAAWLGRQWNLPFGFFNIIPNQYIQIVGVPATKKSTAINTATSLLAKAGYRNFAPEKTSLQQFLIDLNDITWGAQDDNKENTNDDFMLDTNIFGALDPKETAENLPIAEMFITSDEFVDFIGRNNMDFVSLLGTLWQYDKVFSLKLKHSKHVYINKPTINIISGNTHENFHYAFPPEMQGQGFFSRLILIYAEPTNRKIAFPHPPLKQDEDRLIEYLLKMRDICIGEATITDEAKELCKIIYETWNPIEDARFAKYSGRRYTHMLKLSMICAAARLSNIIDTQDILMGNTLLTFAEYNMPKAMGQFGKGRNSAVSHKILEMITESILPVDMKTIIRGVHQDVDNLSAINDIISSLRVADKIQITEDGKFLPKQRKRTLTDSDTIKPSWMHNHELH